MSETKYLSAKDAKEIYMTRKNDKSEINKQLQEEMIDAIMSYIEEVANSGQSHLMFSVDDRYSPGIIYNVVSFLRGLGYYSSYGYSSYKPVDWNTYCAAKEAIYVSWDEAK